MKCSEAVEWMHRYLDHDLNDEESAQLFEHIGNCRDCAEEFDILKRLNSKLEQLPKVMPKISLVDSILPQLDEIDRARREGGSASEVLPGMEPLVAKSAEAATSRSRRQSPWRSRAFRAGTLGVTAAIVLGIFIYNYQPHTVSDAEMSVQSMSSSDKADHAAQSDRADSPAADDGGVKSYLSPEDSDPAGNAGDSVLRSTEQQGGHAGDENPNAARMGDSPVGDSNDSRDSVSKQGSADPKAPNKVDVPASDKASSGQSNEQEKATPKSTASGNTTDSGTASDKVAKDNRSIDNHDRTTDGTEDAGGSIESNQFTIGQNIMGIVAADLWTSPDGGFKVEVNDGHLYLYQNNLDSMNGRTLITDKPIDGVWVRGSWSEDSKSYQYEIEKDGVTSTYTLQADAGSDAAGSTGNNDQSQKNTNK
ncbi:zf-HC2 domain-containing protein [Paenibacillus motobuensis]|uniref:Anti-sigma-W factor RsiW n=1 Tax=Paenibacillus motobuensis TaxID=295324 RepID=A0ABP3IMX9_9BACL